MKKVLNSKRISFWVFTTILSISIIHIAYTAIRIYNNPSTSFPWWTAFYFPGIIYLMLLLISMLVLFYTRKQKI